MRRYLPRYLPGLAFAAALTAFHGPADAQQVSDRNLGLSKRYAEFFSYVCLESAPSFATAKARQDKRGSKDHAFRQQSAPFASFGLETANGSCTCALTYHVKDIETAATALRMVLDARHRLQRAPQTAQTPQQAAYLFGKTVVTVRLLHGTSHNGRPLARAEASRPGGCGEAEALHFRSNPYFNQSVSR